MYIRNESNFCKTIKHTHTHTHDKLPGYANYRAVFPLLCLSDIYEYMEVVAT